MSEVAQLLLPAVRWDAARGFAGEREGIERALSHGVGGFILFGGPADEVRALTRERVMQEAAARVLVSRPGR